MEEKTKEIKNNIVEDAFYLVNLFKSENRPVTQLHIQKLMFLFEAYYMNVKDKISLYDCKYQAWDFGPVAIPLYKQFKKYGKEEIKLTEEEERIGNSIEPEKKRIMANLFKAFKEYNAMELVNFTHAEGSPWYNVWKNKQYSEISKEEMKNWFSRYVRKA